MRTFTLESFTHECPRAGRLPASFAIMAVVALAFAGAAEAAGKGGGAQASSGPQGALGLVSQQASQTVQAAGAQAGAVQVQPVNVAVTVVVNSPGSKPVIVQSNGNSAGAAAGNSSSTTQGSGQSKPSGGTGSALGIGQSGGGSGGGQSQPASQSSQTGQGAGAQAGATQVQPANIAAQTIVNSSGASPVIVQTNGNSAGATAANSSSTNQASGPSQAGSAAPASQPPISPPQNAPPSPPAIPVIDFGGINNFVGPVTGWTLNLNLDWILELAAPKPEFPPLPPLPTMPEVPFPGPTWPFPGGSSPPADETSRPPKDDAVAGGRSGGGTARAGWEFSSNPASSGAEPKSGVSSSFVQTPAKKAEPSQLPLVPLPLPPLPAPTAGGGLFSLAGLVLSAIATLALYFASLGLLLRRLGLASAPWRHQAYLSPLQRPG